MLDKTDLHEYQEQTVTEFYEHDFRLGIVPMGGGKTVSALSAFQEMLRDGIVRKGIVFAPKRVATQTWPAEWHKWAHLAGLKLSIVEGTAAQRAKRLAADADLFVIGIDNTQWLIDQMSTWAKDDPRLDFLVVDEITRYGDPRGKRSHALRKAADFFKLRYGLTGTPRPGSETRFWAIARILARNTIWPETFDEWRMQYFKPENVHRPDQSAWHLRPEWRDKIWGDMASFAFTIDPDRLPPQPELKPIEHWVDLPPKAMKDIDRMWDELAYVGGDGTVVLADNAAIASGKIDQLAQGFIYRDGETFERVHDVKKLALADLLDGLGGQQAMITYWFKEDLEVIRSLLGANVPVLGSVTSDARAAEIIRAWNEGKIEHLAVHPASAGHGLNLQEGQAGQIIHFALPWSAELFDQVSARIARQGNNRERVMNHMILARGTTDEIKLFRIRDNLSEQEAFTKFVGERRA